MKHRVNFRKLGRPSAHRWSLLRTLASQLLQHERIEVTLGTAKELRRVADQVVTLGKQVNVLSNTLVLCWRYTGSLHQTCTFIGVPKCDILLTYLREIWQRGGKLRPSFEGRTTFINSSPS
jgi:hypothetical protein